MTSGLQPTNAGAPQPVPGVTGGPGINQGTASVEPGTGALVFHPQPANVVQVRGSTPGAFQVYEYFHTNTDFSRVSLNAQAGGPFQLAVETQPPTLIRGLQINAGGSIFIQGQNLHVNSDAEITGNLVVDGSTIQFPNSASSLSWAGSGAYLNTDATHIFVIAPPGGQVVLGGFVQIGGTFVLTATAGAATALPATPALYFEVFDQSGIPRRIPAYNP